MDQDSNNKKIDFGDFLEFFLLDSQEQIDKLGAGLLQLEKDGENIALINELFRSAHSLKGASGTMGFTPIVELTHNAEDLLDKLRIGRIQVTNEIIDVLLAVTDKVKIMLDQVKQNLPITEDGGDLALVMKTLAEKGSLTEQELSVYKKTKSDKNITKSLIDFSLLPTELDNLKEAILAGNAIYQIEVTLTPNTLMKAVRAIMVIQRLEPLGSVVKVLPSVEELETNDADKFSLLFITKESPEEIQADIGEVSEILDTAVSHYSISDSASVVNQKNQEGDKKGESHPSESQESTGITHNVDSPPNAQQAKTNTLSSELAGESGNNQVHTIRVDTLRMDNLINLVGEMVITRTRLVKISEDLHAQYQSNGLVSSLNETNVYLGRLMSDLQESVMKLRMVPIGTVFSRYPRLVRDFCRKSGKKIELVIKGEETELDKTVIEMIGDPLTHIIRNSVDHGIEIPGDRLAAGKPENGTITLDAYHEGNHIAIIVSDDGAGLNLKKIYNKALQQGLIGEKEELTDKDIANLIFLPGFSTADKVTDISGRGVGMDVVKKSLNSLGGLIDIKTKEGEGTSFIIRLPLTLAIIQALLVEVGVEIYAIPLSSVIETLIVKNSDIKTVGGLQMVQLRGNTLPIISLKEKFGLPEDREKQDESFVVVVGLGDKAIGLVVDELQGQQEIVIKTLGEYLNGLPGIAGATILGDGKVTLILDIGSLIQDVLISDRLK
ncbi:MAG: chemotaxis protein CheA [Gracilibacter sp. BRH_c7a]|nr:MAG: chemotaxis protein CheA [Gracilibacter sp. BRH_c7a]